MVTAMAQVNWESLGSSPGGPGKDNDVDFTDEVPCWSGRVDF